MNSMKLLSYIGDIAPKFVEAAEHEVKSTIRSTDRNQKHSWRFVPATVCGVLALVVIALLVFPFSSPQNGTQFSGFVLTAYAAGDNDASKIPTVLQDDVEVVLAEYSPVMSSVPGYPFTFGVADGDYELQISVDWGHFNYWEPPAGVVTNLGNRTTVKNGSTLYWSPDETASLDEIPNAIITVKAVNNGEIVGSQEIIITNTDYMYRAKLGM